LFEGEFSDLNKCCTLNQEFLLEFLLDAGNLGNKKEGVDINDISYFYHVSYTTKRLKLLILTAYHQYNEVP